MLYAINDIYPAIQGEGMNAGLPMVIVRLQGCSVGCVWCDQKETWRQDSAQLDMRLSDALGQNPRWAWADEQAIVQHIRDKAPGYRWVLLTGGEPCEQDIAPLVQAFRAADWRTALETSGTARLPTRPEWICCSPKLQNPAGKPIRGEIVRAADELKFVVCRQADLTQIQQFVREVDPDRSAERVLVQPVSQSPKATELCIAACQQYGWRLSVQLHKYLRVA